MIMEKMKHLSLTVTGSTVILRTIVAKREAAATVKVQAFF